MTKNQCTARTMPRDENADRRLMDIIIPMVCRDTKEEDPLLETASRLFQLSAFERFNLLDDLNAARLGDESALIISGSADDPELAKDRDNAAREVINVARHLLELLQSETKTVTVLEQMKLREVLEAFDEKEIALARGASQQPEP